MMHINTSLHLSVKNLEMLVPSESQIIIRVSSYVAQSQCTVLLASVETKQLRLCSEAPKALSQKSALGYFFKHPQSGFPLFFAFSAEL